MKAEPTTLSPRVQFWGPALLVTPTCWVAGIVSLMVGHGETFPRAAVLAFIGAFGGFFLWLTYRVASRRRDGLASLFMGMVLVMAPQKLGSLWRELGRGVVSLVIMALLLCVLGLSLRERRKPAPLPTDDADQT